MATTITVYITGPGAPNTSVGTNVYEYESLWKASNDLLCDTPGDWSTARDLIAQDEQWDILKHPTCPADKFMFDSSNAPGATWYISSPRRLRAVPACTGDATRFIRIASVFGYSSYNKHYPLRDFLYRRVLAPFGESMYAMSHAQWTVIEDIHFDGIGWSDAMSVFPGSTSTTFNNTWMSGAKRIMRRVTARPHLFNAIYLSANYQGTFGTINKVDLLHEYVRCFDLHGFTGVISGTSDSSVHNIMSHCDAFWRGTQMQYLTFASGIARNCYAGSQSTGASANYTAYYQCDKTACVSSDTSGNVGSKTIGDCYDGTISNAYVALSSDADDAFQGFPKAGGPLDGTGSTADGLTEDWLGVSWVSNPSVGASEVESAYPADPTMTEIFASLDRSVDNVFPLARGVALSHNDGFSLGGEGGGVKTLGGDYGLIHFGPKFRACDQSDGHGGSADNAKDCNDPDGDVTEARRWHLGETSYRPTLNAGSHVSYPSTAVYSASHSYNNSGGIPGTNDILLQCNNPNSNAENATNTKLYRINQLTGEVVADVDITAGADGLLVGGATSWWSASHETMLVFVVGETNNRWEFFSYDITDDTVTSLASGATTGIGFNTHIRRIDADDLVIFISDTGDLLSMDISNLGSIVIENVTDQFNNLDDIYSRATSAWDWDSRRSLVQCWDGSKLWTFPRSQAVEGADAADITEASALPLDTPLGLLRMVRSATNIGNGTDIGNGYYDANYDAFAVALDGDTRQWVWAPSQEEATTTTGAAFLFKIVGL